MSKRKYDSSEDDADESTPKLFRWLYAANKYNFKDDDENAKKYWDKSKRRVKKRRYMKEAQFKADGFILPLHRAIEHAAPYNLIKALVNAYADGCSVVMFGDEMPLKMACGYPRRLATEVNNLRYDSEWEKVILLLMRKNPAAIDASKNTALHLVLEHNPSLELVKEMIELHQSSKTSVTSRVGKNKKTKRKKKVSLLEMRDEQNQLPLHIAVENVVATDVVLKLLRSYPEAATCPRENHDRSLPLHCAVSFGCSGKVLTQIIRAYPDALLKKENSGNTPLHMLFHMDTNINRWNIGNKSDDSDGDALLSETAICQLLLEYIPEATMISTLKMSNNSGYTVVEAANECATECRALTTHDKVFTVPDDLIKLLVKAENGKFTSQIQPPQRTRADISLNVRHPYDLSTDEGSNDSDSDSSSDDSSDSKG